MTTKQFGIKLGEILTTEHLTADMIWQEDLFALQSSIAQLMCDAANDGNAQTQAMANGFISKNPSLFN